MNRLSKEHVNDLARPLVTLLIDFYKDPKNEEDFQRWLHEKESVATK